jgi:AcrR family transcriptional regulator
MDAPNNDPLATRQRLLDTAGEVFAAAGFRNATVRDICAKAGANIAAVNYHFGGKEGLYAEVLRHAHASAFEKYPPDMGLKPGATPRQRLHAFVRSFLLRVLDDGRPAWHGKLMVREIADPTSALEAIVRDGIRPHFATLRGIVADLLGPKLAADPERVRFAAWSVVGQCLFYFVGRPVSSSSPPRRRSGPGTWTPSRATSPTSRWPRSSTTPSRPQPERRRRHELYCVEDARRRPGQVPRHHHGLTFASLLITQQLAIFIGLMARTYGAVTDLGLPDAWVMDPKVQFIDDIKPLQDTQLYRVRGVEGVEWAVPLYKGLIKARLDNGNFQTCNVFGLDDATLIGGPPVMLEGELADLGGPTA